MPIKKAKSSKKRTAVKSKKQDLASEIKEVEAYEYLLVEYLKEISNEITYLLLMIVSLFLYLMIEFIQLPDTVDTQLVKLVFIILTIGGFGLFGLSSFTKRKIEKKFEYMFY